VATIQQSIVPFTFVIGDGAASPGAFPPITPVGMPDGADFSCLQMPFAGTIVGITVQSPVAAIDTVLAQPTIGNNKTFGANTPVASLLTTVTNAGGGANSTIVTKDQADAQFAAGQWVGVQYETTTSGAYTVHDILVTLYISTGRTDL
jgi:hypothetical protein